MLLSDYKKKFIQSQGKLALKEQELTNLKIEKAHLEKEKIRFEKAQIFLQEVAKKTQEQLKIHIEDIVNLALNEVFPGKYVFSLEFVVKSGKTEALLVFKDGEEIIDPFDSSGGGVVDVAAFALRIATWSLGKTRNTIILDEPFKNLSVDLLPYGAEVLKELSDELGLQFIIVTHIDELTNIANKVFTVHLEKKNGFDISKVEVTKNVD